MFGVTLVDPYGGLTIEWLGGASVALVVSLITRLLVGIGWMGLFKKAEKPAWMAFVPLLGEYQAFRLSWDDFGASCLFASLNFVGWVCVCGVQNPLCTGCSVVALIMWWFYCFITATVAFKSSIIWGIIYAIVPWAGALIFGWMPTFRYYNAWSSDPDAPQNLSKKERKKRLKEANKKANKK